MLVRWFWRQPQGSVLGGWFYIRRCSTRPIWICAVVDSKRAVSWLLVAHHWWAGLGTFVLCRRYGFRWSAALLAGIAYLAAPYYVAGTGEGHYNQSCLVAWVPWAFLLVERLRSGQRGGVVGTSIVLALAFFCGHVQECFYLVLLLTAFLSFDVLGALWRRLRTDARGALLIPNRNPAAGAS